MCRPLPRAPGDVEVDGLAAQRNGRHAGALIVGEREPPHVLPAAVFPCAPQARHTQAVSSGGTALALDGQAGRWEPGPARGASGNRLHAVSASDRMYHRPCPHMPPYAT